MALARFLLTRKIREKELVPNWSLAGIEEMREEGANGIVLVGYPAYYQTLWIPARKELNIPASPARKLPGIVLFI